MSGFSLYTSIYTVGDDGAKEQFHRILEYSRKFNHTLKIFTRAVLSEIFYQAVILSEKFLPSGYFLNQVVNHCLPVILNRHIDR